MAKTGLSAVRRSRVVICSRLLVDVIDPFGDDEAAGDWHDDWSSRSAERRNDAGYGTSHGHTDRADSLCEQ